MSLVLGAAALAQAILLAVALRTMKRGNTSANRWLAALMLTVGAMVGGSMVSHSAVITQLPHAIALHHPLDFVVGPVLLLYVRSLSQPQRRESRDLLHFVPAVACALVLVPFYVQDGDAKLARLESDVYRQWYYLRAALALSIGAVYVVLTVRLAAPQWHRPASAQLKFLCVGFCAVLAIATLRYVVDALMPTYILVTNLWLPVTGTVILFGTTLLGLRNPVNASPARKYETSSLTDDRSDRGLQLLRHALDQERAYLDPDLTLNGLAARLRLPGPHLSRIINERLQKSFSDLINGYRIEEAKRRLLDPSLQHYSILGIAEDVGFRSKSSFNVTFKRHTGLTPSEFRRSVARARRH